MELHTPVGREGRHNLLELAEPHTLVVRVARRTLAGQVVHHTPAGREGRHNLAERVVPHNLVVWVELHIPVEVARQGTLAVHHIHQLQDNPSETRW